MGQGSVARRGAGLPRTTLMLMVLLAGCAPRFGGPAPLVNGGEASTPAQITVQHGQTLSGIARHYHVPMQAIAEANHLSPPYRILAGGTLIIPGGYGGPAGPSVAMATTPPPIAAAPEGPVAAAPLPPPSSGAPPPGAEEGPPIPPGPSAPSRVEPAPPPPLPQIAGHATPEHPVERTTAQDHSPPSGAAGLTSSGESAATHPEALHPAPAKPPTSVHPGAVASAEPPPAPTHHGGSFLWPVRGHVLENYGTGPDGTHNDGINIAAPRGAPVQATDAGVVAYAGNELRGYGNLVLIKHPNGFISAYAHCDLILVKTGQKVARGQVIARVGATGNVSAPQLHFELRRGKRPVDPRDYLAPLPSVATKAQESG